MKRALSMVMVFVLLLGMFSGLKLPAKAASITYNSGKREVVCDELSAAATAYYTGGYSYEQLSALRGSTLRTKLRTLINSDRSTVGYDGLKKYFPYTDAYQGSSQKLTLFYCNGTTTSSWDGAKTWNREHMWPDSLGGGAMEGDLHAMRPTDPKANSTRGNHKYGEVSNGKEATTNDANGSLLSGYYSSSLFEPLDFAKGDCARVVLYDYVVASSMSSVTEVFQNVQTLLDWCALDPVDAYEMSRNDVAEQIQGCRNPFVDYPELAWLLLDKEIPADLVSPSGNGNNVKPSYKITASSNNTALGTVSMDGSSVVAKPAEGCYAEGYTILSGSATVTREDNVFHVEAKSDCSIRINFARKQEFNVTFNILEKLVTVYAGESIILPEGADEDRYSFVGWITEDVEATTDKPLYYPAGSTYTVTSNVDFRALYTYVEGGSGSGQWSLVTDSKVLKAGAGLVLACTEQNVTAGDIGGTYLKPIDTSFAEDGSTIPTLPEETVIFTLGGSEGAWTFTDLKGRQLGCTDKKKMAWDAGVLTWDIEILDDGASVFSTDSGNGRILYNVSAPRFTTYTGSPTKALPLPQLYVKDGSAGILYYTTCPKVTSECTHSSAVYVEFVDGGCESVSVAEHYRCNTCGKLFTDAACTVETTYDNLLMYSTGHVFKTEIEVEPGCESEGRDIHVCMYCGQTYPGTTIPALGHDWNEGEVIEAPTQTAEGVMKYSCLRCEAVKHEVIPPTGAEDPNGCEKGEHCGAYTFMDMPEVGFWSHAGIDYALEHGLFNGMSETYFGLDIAMTRGMLITVLWRSAGRPETEPAGFTDVSPDAYYAQAVAWAADKGIVKGISETLFAPEAKITREQLATILYRYANFQGADTEAQTELTVFPDADAINEYGHRPMQWAVAMGLINGVSELGTAYLRPQGEATRAQVATILMRFLEGTSFAG